MREPTINQDYLQAMNLERKGQFHAALEHYNWALDFFLYKMMWTIADIRPIQEGRFRCFRAIAGGA